MADQRGQPTQRDWDAELSVSQIRILRAHASRVAEVFADRWAAALAGEDYFSAAYWSGRYSSAAARCVQLGEQLRAPEGVRPRRPLGGHVLGSRT